MPPENPFYVVRACLVLHVFPFANAMLCKIESQAVAQLKRTTDNAITRVLNHRMRLGCLSWPKHRGADKHGYRCFQLHARSFTVHRRLLRLRSLNLSASPGGGGCPQSPPRPPPSCDIFISSAGFSGTTLVFSLIGPANTGPREGLFAAGKDVAGKGNASPTAGAVDGILTDEVSELSSATADSNRV